MVEIFGNFSLVIPKFSRTFKFSADIIKMQILMQQHWGTAGDLDICNKLPGVVDTAYLQTTLE